MNKIDPEAQTSVRGGRREQEEITQRTYPCTHNSWTQTIAWRRPGIANIYAN